MSIRYYSQYNEDGTSTFTVRCRLEVIEDADGFASSQPNPIYRLEWSESEQNYVVAEPVFPVPTTTSGDRTGLADRDDDDDDRVIPDVSFGDLSEDPTPPDPVIGANTNTNTNTTNTNTNTNTNATFLARECWCARLFQPGGGFETATVVYGELGLVMPDPNPPVWCPLETSGTVPHSNPSNIDFITATTPSGAFCTATAVVGPKGVVETESYAAVCYSEDPIEEFARSAWPLCCFWIAMLVYVGCFTHYGRRCQSYVWRITVLTAEGMCRPSKPEDEPQRRGRARGEEGNNARDEGGDIEENRSGAVAETDPIEAENGTSPTVESQNTEAQTQTPTPTNTDNDNEDENDENTDNEVAARAAIEAEFGSYRNYQLLDDDLHNLARRTDNEYITWLWYSAVHREEQNVHRDRIHQQRQQQWRQRQRERRRRQRQRQRRRENNPDDADNADDADHSSANESNPEERDGGLPSRRLDPVYWWPPSGPDGTRWQHLVVFAAERQQQQQQQQDRNAPGVLCLRTKVFSARDAASAWSEDRAGDTVDGKESTAPDFGGETTIRTGDGDGNGSGESGLSSKRESSCRGDTEDGEDKDKDSENDSDAKQQQKEQTPPDEEALPEATVCSICLCEIEDGEIVGDIPCGHYFHKDCLKEWLIKSNLCPFCRRCDIAVHKPRTDGNDGAPTR